MLRNNLHNKRGVAIIFVIVALSMLIIIAIPFASSMVVERRAAKNNLHRTQARLAATGGLEYATSRLTRTHEFSERQKNSELFSSPYFDSPEEFNVKIDLPGINTNDPQGAIWSVDIEDEQGKVNLHSATPWLLGNLIGSAIAEENADAFATTIKVDSTFHFPPNNGLLWINGELVSYTSKDEQNFYGCERGLQSELPNFLGAGNIFRGTLIVDARAYRIVSQQTILGLFRNIEEVKTIGNFGSFGLSAETFDRIYSLVTVHSQSANGSKWIHEQIAEFTPGDNPEEPDAFIIANPLFYIPGMIVKIKMGNSTEMAMIMGSGQKVTLDRRLTNRVPGNAIVSVMSPSPININTATPRVLFAIFKGLQVGNNWISNREAGALTNEIMNIRSQKGFFTSYGGFQNFLEDMRVKYNETLDGNGEPFFSKKKINRILSAAISINGLRNRFHGINVRPSNISTYRAPFPRTSSLTFTSNDSYTLFSTGIMNDETGIPLAQVTKKQIVQIAPSDTLTWLLETQQDFENHIMFRPSSRIISYPNFTNVPVTFAEIEKKENTGVMLDTFTTDYQAPQGSKISHLAKFDDTHEGVFSAQKIDIKIKSVEIVPGCISFWFKANSVGQVQLFNMGDPQKTQNRITCFVQGGNLTLQLYDGTSENAHSEITAPISFGRNWNHIMATWYSSDFGGLALWVDGKPVGDFRYRINGSIVDIKLNKKLQDDDTTISLSRTTGLPKEGAIKIGNEIIEYENITGNTLVVRKSYQGFEQNTLARGARGTTAAVHEKDVPVTPLGYSNTINSPVFPATNLNSAIGKDDVFSNTTSALAEKTDTISVNSTKGFPTSGFVLVIDPLTLKTEKIRYFRTDSTKLRGCIRGSLNTTAGEFDAGAFVVPISISIDDNSDYPDSGFVQIDNEWLQYVAKIDKDVLLFNLERSKIQDLISKKELKPSYRKAKGTISTSHSDNSKVIPVFTTTFSLLGRFDQVTIVNKNNFSEQENMEVNWAVGNLVAFTEDVAREYEPDPGTRILKFPSGELPSESNSLSVGGQVIVDELQLLEASGKFNSTLTEILDNVSPDIVFNNISSLPQDGGIFKIGDEYVAYSKQNNGVLENVNRGFLLSTRSDYDLATPIYPVFFIATSSLKSEITPEGIPLESASDFPRTGHVICDNEIISYSNKTGNTLSLPSVIRGDGGRGAFGSSQSKQSSGAIVYFFPVRFWDRALETSLDSEMAFFETAKTAPGALWREITWNADLPSPSLTTIKILARVDGIPEWSKEPQNQPGEIYEFTDAKALNVLNIKGDTLEIRVFFEYQQGAFARGVWKESPLLKSISVTYNQKCKVYESE